MFTRLIFEYYILGTLSDKLNISNVSDISSFSYINEIPSNIFNIQDDDSESETYEDSNIDEVEFFKDDKITLKFKMLSEILNQSK